MRKMLFAGMLSLLVLLMAMPFAAAETQKATGTANGFGGELTVEVTVDGKQIVSVEVLENKETPGVADPAINNLPGEIVAAQSVAVDVKAGCTLASNAVLEATKAALLSLGFTEEEITAKVEAPAPAAEEIMRTADVIVIGTGGAGMTAAYVAAKNGASVIAIDKMSYTGGNTLAAGSSMNASDPARQGQLTMEASEMSVIKNMLALEPRCELMAQWQADVRKDIEAYEANGDHYLYDSPALHALQTYVEGDYVGNPELIDLFARKAPEAVTFLEDLGTIWNHVYAGMGATWRRTHDVEQNWGAQGAAFVYPQQKAFEELGGEICLNFKADKLLVEDGRVVGVSGVTADGAPFTLKANKGVVLATGGFASNVEMRQAYNKHWPPLGENIRSTNVSSSTGDGIAMATEIGANVIDMEWIQLVPAAAKMTVGLSASINNTIYVNHEGKRFVREDGRRDDMAGAALAQLGQEYYRFTDMHLYEEIGGLTTYGKQVDEVVDGVNLIKAETLEEMAAAIGCDAQNLIDTINAYNSYVENGEDPEFGRKVFGEKLDKGPYYAVKGEVRVHHTMGGVEINEQAQVLDTQGNVIPGLYAAGEVTGGIHGANRLGGNAIADIIVFGRIAGENVSK